MAGILDALFRAAPRVAAAGFAGRNQREQTEYDRAEKERAFQEKVKQQALEQELAQAQNLRSNQLAEAQMGEIAASAAERRARAEGTGAYAPKPQDPPAVPRPFIDLKRGLLVDPTGKATRYAGGGGAGGVGGEGGGEGGVSGKKPTAAEQTKGLLSASALPAFQQMIETDPDGSNPRFKMQRSKNASVLRGLLPESLEGPVQGAIGQMSGSKVGSLLGAESMTEDLRAEQAATQFIDSWIRAVSGAAVPEQELQRYLKTYTPSAWEPDELKAQKAQAWVTLMNALEAAAGQAASLKTPEERKAFALSIVANGGQGLQSERPPEQSSPRQAGPPAEGGYDAAAHLRAIRSRQRP